MRVLLVLAITLGAVIGVPIDPEKIREILGLSSRDEQAETAPERSEGDEDIEEYLNRRGLRSDRDETFAPFARGLCEEAQPPKNRLTADAKTERSPSLLTSDF